MILTTLEQILTYVPCIILLAVVFLYCSKETNLNRVQSFNLKRKGVLIANLVITILLIIRWIRSGHLPLSNLYESSIFLSWSLTLLHLIIEPQSQNKWLGAVIVPSAMLIYGFATLGLPKEMKMSTSLVPALQSHWLMMHVSMMILSYAALLCGSLLAITLLALNANYLTKFKTSNLSINLSSLSSVNQYDLSDKIEKNISNQSANSEFYNFRKKELIEQLDYWSYKIIGIGFPLLTIGILSGAVWANEAWGSYWSWDPKETWALVTWFIFAIYLHTRMTKGWQGPKSAWVASLGFFCSLDMLPWSQFVRKRIT